MNTSEVTPKSVDEAGHPGPPPAPSEEDSSGFLYRAERLPGGVGYMDLRVFASPQSGAGDAAASAMNELNDTGVLVFDITPNMGGDPEMVALLCSYLFGPEPIHLNAIRWRVDTTSRLKNSGHNPRWKGSAMARTSRSMF